MHTLSSYLYDNITVKHSFGCVRHVSGPAAVLYQRLSIDAVCSLRYKCSADLQGVKSLSGMRCVSSTWSCELWTPWRMTWASRWRRRSRCCRTSTRSSISRSGASARAERRTGRCWRIPHGQSNSSLYYIY